jgi:hypothetical protein
MGLSLLKMTVDAVAVRRQGYAVTLEVHAAVEMSKDLTSRVAVLFIALTIPNDNAIIESSSDTARSK